MLRALLAAIPLSAIVMVSTVQAKAIPELTNFMKDEISRQVLVQQEMPVNDVLMGRYDQFAFAGFRIKVNAEIGFDVGLARITLVPVAELFFE